MSLRNFLKLTKEKTIITIVLIIVFVPFLSIDSGIGCVQAPCDSSTPASVIVYLLALIGGTFIYGASYLILIIGVIASYIASCFIIIIYKKIKKVIK